MKRSEHFNVVAGKWLNGYSLPVNGRRYELYVVDIGADCCTVRSVSDFLREKNKFFCGDIVAKYGGGVPAYCFVDAFTDVSGIFTVVFKTAHCCSGKGMYRVLEEVAFEHRLSRGFKYVNENNTLCPVSCELTDGSCVFNCSDGPVSVLADRKTGTCGFAGNKFPFIVPFHRFNPANIVGSLQHNVVKQQ